MTSNTAGGGDRDGKGDGNPDGGADGDGDGPISGAVPSVPRKKAADPRPAGDDPGPQGYPPPEPAEVLRKTLKQVEAALSPEEKALLEKIIRQIAPDE
ncbi:hypothetical protein [Roseibium aquae]|nr:hypothetical protein [Roseibium aquae]